MWRTGKGEPKGALAGLAVALVVVGLAVACSADPPCVLGSPGWCENEMAALAVRTVVGSQPEQVSADEIAIVSDGFVVDDARYGGQKVLSVKPEDVEQLVASSAAESQRLLVLVGSVQVVNASGPGNVAAQGIAIVSVYQGGKRVRQEEVRGKLAGGTWVVVEHRRVEAGNST